MQSPINRVESLTAVDIRRQNLKTRPGNRVKVNLPGVESSAVIYYPTEKLQRIADLKPGETVRNKSIGSTVGFARTSSPQRR